MQLDKAAQIITPAVQDAYQTPTTLRARGRRRLCLVDSGCADSPLSRRARELEKLAWDPDTRPEDVRRIEWVLAIIIHATEAGFSFSDEAFEKVIAAHGKRIAQTIRSLTSGTRTGKKIQSGAVPTPRTLWRWLSDYL